jgi:hypothetical protein
MEEQVMFKESKKYLKETALKIRDWKNKRKLENRGDFEEWRIEAAILELKYDFRHYHIATSELRGRKREEIETPADNNKPDQKFIDWIKKDILEKYEQSQTIRDNS